MNFLGITFFKRLFLIYKSKGAVGVLEFLKKERKSNNFLNFLLFLDEKVFILKSMMEFVVETINEVEKKGIEKTSKKLVDKLSIGYRLKNDMPKELIKSKKGVIIVGLNHIGDFEPYVLLSLVKRKDIKVIINRIFWMLGDGIKSHTYPVISRRCSEERKMNFLKRFDISERICKVEFLTEEEIVKINNRSLKKASNYLNNGGIVMIFPAGAGDGSARWARGFSKILSGIKKEKMKNVSLIPVHFEGIGAREILIRVYRAFRGKRQSKAILDIEFGKITNAKNLYDKNRGVEQDITDNYRKETLHHFAIGER